MTIDAPNLDGFLVAEVKKHEWMDAKVEQLIKWIVLLQKDVRLIKKEVNLASMFV